MDDRAMQDSRVIINYKCKNETTKLLSYIAYDRKEKESWSNKRNQYNCPSPEGIRLNVVVLTYLHEHVV